MCRSCDFTYYQYGSKSLRDNILTNFSNALCITKILASIVIHVLFTANYLFPITVQTSTSEGCLLPTVTKFWENFPVAMLLHQNLFSSIACWRMANQSTTTPDPVSIPSDPVCVVPVQTGSGHARI